MWFLNTTPLGYPCWNLCGITEFNLIASGIGSYLTKPKIDLHWSILRAFGSLQNQSFNLASFYLLALGVVMRLTSLVVWITLWICGRSCLYSLHVVLLTVHCIPQNSPLAVSGLSGECDSCPNERIRSSGWFDLACFMCEKSDQLVSLIIFSTDIHSFLYFGRDKASFAPRLPGKSWQSTEWKALFQHAILH